jgi:hypothetical protein
MAGADRRRQPLHDRPQCRRALSNGNPVGNDAISSIAWSVGLIAVFAGLRIRKFNHSTIV